MRHILWLVGYDYEYMATISFLRGKSLLKTDPCDMNRKYFIPIRQRQSHNRIFV